MACVGWWPLNGNAKDNIAGRDLTISGTYEYGGMAGGKCLRIAGSKSGSVMLSELAGAKTFSVSMWIKDDSATANSTWCDYWGLTTSKTVDGSSSTALLRLEYSSYDLSFFNNSHWTTSAGIYARSWTAAGWHHIVLTADDTTFKSYADGKLVMTDSKTNSDADISLTGAFTIGDYGNYTYLSDVRVYDHTLSRKEVYELSKGMFLRYAFDDEYLEPTANIDPYRNLIKDHDFKGLFSCPTSRTDVEVSYSFGHYYGRDCIEIRIEGTPTADTLYSYMSSHPLSLGCSGGQTVTRSCMMYVPQEYSRPGWFRESIEGDVTNTSNVQYDWEKQGTWQRVSMTGTLPSSGSNNFIHYFTASATNIYHHLRVYLCDFQMEVCDHATPYANGSRAGRVFDGSGMGNDGELSETGIRIVSADAAGGKAAQFDGTTYITANCSTAGNDTATYAAWVYPTSRATEDDGVSHSFRSCIAIGGTYFTISQDGYLSGYAYGKTPAGYHTGSTPIPLNQWTHVAIVWDDSYIIGYVNGAQDFKISCTGTFSNTATTQLIGKEADYGRPFVGMMSDLRIYGTALTADDIKSLCVRKASIGMGNSIHSPSLREPDFNMADIVDQDVRIDKSRKYFYCFSQANCTTSPTEDGLHVVRTANHDGRAISGSGWDNWGGAAVYFLELGRKKTVSYINSSTNETLLYDESDFFVKGHRYRICWHVKGYTSETPSTYFTNSMGWGASSSSCGPAPVDVVRSSISAGFGITSEGAVGAERECFYEFTLNEDVYKTCTSAYSIFALGNKYPAYKFFVLEQWDYSNVGDYGTDIYISNIRCYDVTEPGVSKAKVLGIGMFSATQLEESSYCSTNAGISRNGALSASAFYED